MFSTENEDHLIMHFSDDTSAFDGKKREALLGKGAVNNQFNAFIMNHLKDNGVESHLIEVIDSTDSLVYKLDMFPIECVIRNRASGSICKRLGTEDGLVLENPLFEFFLKDDDLGDPLINDEHIISFGWASHEHIQEMKKQTYLVNEILSKHLETNFFVYMIGFVPGQPFLGDLNKSLYHDRLDTPRVKINKGSVGIVEKFCTSLTNASYTA